MAPIDDARVRAFARAREASQAVQAGVQRRLAEVTSAAEARALQDEAERELRAVVEASGLSMEDYAGVAQRMGHDAELRERVEAASGRLRDLDTAP
ncbi:hypothetical protein DL240_17215 [Lujinxingia litoralis]|uniref:DUF4168 domain-containing protein n=1 Tax=Lujinxingia litoralis TaxID=2211119 RepID=A0A328C4T5_9DELT|nr:hypothetical protein DL240_17215 [Lujinxingia litoralis]